MSDYNEFLNTAVLQENKPVTYKSLARSLKIHVDTAKQALYKFSTENTSNVHAVYCITGKTVKNNQFTIQLVKSAELEEAKKFFKEITGVHVYSVTSFDPIDFSILYTACKDVPKLSIKERYECGVLKTANATMKDLLPSRTVMGSKKQAATPVVAKPAVSKATQSKPSISKPAPKSTPTVAKKGTLSFAAVKKDTSIAAKKEAPVKSTKTEIKKPVEKKSVSGIKRKVDHDDIEKRLAKTTIKPKDIFSSDEEEEEEEKAPEPEEAIPMEVEDDIMDEAEELPKAKKNDDNAQPPAKEEPPAPPGKVKRKVLRKKTTTNARGLMVTEEVWDWETVDASEVEESSSKPTPSKPSAPAKTAPTNKTTGGPKKLATAQTNLFSFFNKK